MLTGMVQCRHPYNIKKARQQTDEYLRQLGELSSPILEMYKKPAGGHSKQREDIPYFFAWSLLNGGHPGEEPQQEAWANMVPPPAPATGGDGVVGGEGAARNVTFDLPSPVTTPPPAEVPAPSSISEVASPVSKPAAKVRPYLPLRAQKVGLAPKVGETDAPEDLAILETTGAVAPAEEEGEKEAEEDLSSEYQRAFVWPDFERLERARPLLDKYQPSRVFAKDDLELVMAHRKRGGGATPRSDDHLWSLLTTDLPLPPVAPSALPLSRPDTDQLWDLLEPDVAPAPCVVGGAGGAVASPRVVRGGGPALAPSESTASVAGDVATLSTTTTTSGGRKGASEGRRRRAEQARRQAVAAAVTQVHSSATGPMKGRGRRRKRVAKADQHHSFNPILMNPRYPLLRPAKDTFRSEYTAKFIWPTSPLSLAAPF